MKQDFRGLILVAISASLLLSGCNHGMTGSPREFGPAVEKDAPMQAVDIHRPQTLGALDTSLKDVRGRPVGISCTTCHGSQSQTGLLEPGVAKDFHRGLKVNHGNLSCTACHDQDRSLLHLADATKLEFDQSMKLCAQCHGVQYRDYSKGAHGGMNGYWDLRRGGRERNTCIDCHAPHSPAYEKMWPVHPPKDRFLDWKRNEPQAHE